MQKMKKQKIYRSHRMAIIRGEEDKRRLQK